jgi:hypothetical protein
MTILNWGLFTSIRGDWKTPKALYQALDAEFHFDFDPCPTKPKVDGLKTEWGNTNFVNPPYGKEISNWIQKGYQENLNGKTVVFLLPSRTDTRWWHEYIMKAAEIRFIKGRLRFDDQKNPAPFPSAIVIFKPKNGKPNRQEK